MTEKAKKYIIDINEIDVDKIIYVKPNFFYTICYNMGIYYAMPEEKKRKIIIQTPKMLIPFDIKKYDNGPRKIFRINISFNVMTNLYNEEDIKKFYELMKNIDRTNQRTIKKYTDKWGIPSSLVYKKTIRKSSSNFPHYISFDVPFDEIYGYYFHVYNDKGERITIEELTKKSVVSLILELTDLKFTDKKIYPNWTILQIKKFKPYSAVQEFFMSRCFIDDNEIINVTPHVISIKPPEIPSPPEKKKEETIIQNTFQPPSLEELLKARNLLKKTETVVKGGVEGKILNPPTVPVLRNKKKKKR